MTLLVEPSQGSANLFLSALGSHATTMSSLGELRDKLPNMDDEDVVVLGPSVDSMAAMRLASDYRVTRPTLGVVLIRRRVDTSLLADAMRHGVRDVVEERDLAGLNAAVQRARTLAEELRIVGSGVGETAEARPHGRVVTVFSAKGGCGKTTISTNLAALIAAEHGLKVCLVDLDLAFGDVSISLQLTPTHSIRDAVDMGATLDSDGLDSLLTKHASGLMALTAPIGPDSRESIKPELVDRILSLLVREFDIVIVDTPPSFDDTVLAAFDRTDELLLLTTLDIPAVKNLKMAAETLELINFPPQKTHIVVNRADARVGLDVSDVEKALKIDVAGRVPSSRDVPASTNRGLAITIDNPKHPVSQALRAIAADRLALAEPGQASPATSRRGLFRPRGG